MAKSTFAKISAGVILIFILTMMISCLIPFAHSATTAPRPNSLGLSQTYENPVTYMVGSVTHVDGFSKATSVTFQPFGASLLDTETILFCGDLVNEFDGGTYVVAYQQRARRMYRGVGCHDIYRIVQIESVQ